jgi:hypothetical protein
MLRSKERRVFGASSNSCCDGGDGDDGGGVAFAKNFRLPKNGFPSKVAAVKTLPFLAALLLSGAALARHKSHPRGNLQSAPHTPRFSRRQELHHRDKYSPKIVTVIS